MANQHYQSGRAFEYQVKHDLERRGYYCVRAAGSHSKVDVVAVKGSICLFLQCKTDGAISLAEWDTLYSICACPSFLPIVAVKDPKLSYRLITGRRTHHKREWTLFDPGDDGTIGR
jgi:hypothetical protein